MKHINNVINFKQEKQNFNLPYNVFFCFDSDNIYRHTLYELDDTTILRGIYGSDKEDEFNLLLKEFNGWASKGCPSKEQVVSFYEDKITSLSNITFSISTDYSKIIIEHATQYEQPWSDIRRIKNGS